MPFEVFNKRTAPRSKEPSVTIQKRGIFSMNRAAHNLIGGAESVELLYDPEARIVALRPSTAAHAYTLRPQSRDAATGQVILSATAFTQHYDIDTTESRRYKPYESEGMLCIDLNGESVVVRGNRARKTPDAEEPAED